MGKVSTLTHFLIEPGSEDISFLDQAVKDLEHGPDSILTNTIKTLEYDASFAELDACLLHGLYDS